MNLNKENVKSLIADIFPNSEIKTIKLSKYGRRVNFIAELYDYENKTIFIKCAKMNCDTSYVSKMNLIFLKEKKEEMISTPSIYHVDPEKKSLLWII